MTQKPLLSRARRRCAVVTNRLELETFCVAVGAQDAWFGVSGLWLYSPVLRMCGLGCRGCGCTRSRRSFRHLGKKLWALRRRKRGISTSSWSRPIRRWNCGLCGGIDGGSEGSPLARGCRPSGGRWTQPRCDGGSEGSPLARGRGPSGGGTVGFAAALTAEVRGLH
jgi:hypothetical protein